MKFGIIGFGRIAHKFCESIEATTGTVSAIASKSVKEDDPYLLAHPDVKVFHDYDEMLNSDCIDAVYIAVPHKFHKHWVMQALKAHKAVLCEKPAVLDVYDMIEIKECAIENQTYFLEALKTKLNDGMDHLKEDVKLLGKLESIECNFCSDARKARGSDTFLFDKEQGGALNDVASYLLGFVFELNKNDVINIESSITLYDEIEEHFTATLTFVDGMKAYIEGAIDEAKERYALIKGEKGTIKVPMFNRIIDYTINLNGEEPVTKTYPIKGNDMSKQIQCLIDDVQANKIQNDVHSLDDSIMIIGMTNKIREFAK